MYTKQLFKYQSLAFVTGCAVLSAFCITAATARAEQMFVSVNSNPFGNGGSRIYQYDPTGSTGTPVVPYFFNNLDHPRDLAFDSAGNLYVATFTWLLDSEDNILGYDHGSILKVSGGVASTFATFQGASAHGLVINSDGDMFVSSLKFDDTESTIYKVTPGGAVSIVGSVPGQSIGLALKNGTGDLFAAGASDSTNTCGTIYRFDSAGVRSIFVGTESFFCSAPGPAALTFDASGNLFVTTEDNSGNGDIREFDTSGTEVVPRFATGFTSVPRGLAFDSHGNLFLADTGVGPTIGDILKFTPGGTGSIPSITAAPGFGVAYFDQGAPDNHFGFRGNRGPEYVAFAPPAITITPASTSVVLTFPNTTEPLTTTVVASLDQNSVPLPSPNFELTGSNLAFEITAPTTPAPPIIIAFTVPQSLDAEKLKVMHWNRTTSAWDDVTCPVPNPGPTPDTTNNTVYGSVSSLSPFLITKFKYGAQIQQPINANGTSVFNAKRGVVPVTFKLTSDGAATCALPPATISVFRTSGGVVGSIDESVYLLKSDSGSNFRISSCQYVYNLNTSSFGPGTYQVYISIGGSVAGSATFALK